MRWISARAGHAVRPRGDEGRTGAQDISHDRVDLPVVTGIIEGLCLTLRWSSSARRGPPLDGTAARSAAFIPPSSGRSQRRAALERGTIRGDEVDELLMGHARQAGSGPNPARQVVRRAGLPDSVPAQTINKACASGMEAVATAARAILLGETHVAVAGGIESMSRMPYLIDSEDARWGHQAWATSPWSTRCTATGSPVR